MIALIATFSLFAPASVAAKCGTGNGLSYDDITSVLLTNDYRASDGYRYEHVATHSLRHSSFWLHFWDASDARHTIIFPTTYSQYTLTGSIGTFRIAATLAQARAILKRDHFYELSPEEDQATETTWSTLTALRCAVVTRIRMIMDIPEFDEPATAKLFDDFYNLLAVSPKTKLSDSPTAFNGAGIFDP